jgi:hypothetical protein
VSSRAEQIRELAKKGLTTHQIARKVYGLAPNARSTDVDRKAAYVRVVLRQRDKRGLSPADLAWATRKYGSWEAFYKQRYRDNREYHLAYWANRWRTDPEYREACRRRKRARRLKAMEPA